MLPGARVCADSVGSGGERFARGLMDTVLVEGKKKKKRISTISACSLQAYRLLHSFLYRSRLKGDGLFWCVA